MFCTKCGKELNSNNVCSNESCPSYIINNNSTKQEVGFNQNFNNSRFNMYNNFRDQNGISATELMEFVGDKNVDYFVNQWSKSQENKNFLSWNWPAFFGNFFWFWYRKMYGMAAIVFFLSRLFMILGILLAFVFSEFIPYFSELKWISFLIILLVPVGVSLIANQLYLKHVTKKINSIRLTASMGLTNYDTFLKRLRANGGTI
jgi:multisubunit Na+/H+ antiporter MnhG subunit